MNAETSSQVDPTRSFVPICVGMRTTISLTAIEMPWFGMWTISYGRTVLFCLNFQKENRMNLAATSSFTMATIGSFLLKNWCWLSIRIVTVMISGWNLIWIIAFGLSRNSITRRTENRSWCRWQPRGNSEFRSYSYLIQNYLIFHLD